MPKSYSVIVNDSGHEPVVVEVMLVRNLAVLVGAVVNVVLARAGVAFLFTKTDFSKMIVALPLAKAVVPVTTGVGGVVVPPPVPPPVLPPVPLPVPVVLAVAQFGSVIPQISTPLVAKLKAEPSPPAQPDKAVVVANNAQKDTKRMILIHTNPDIAKLGRVVLILR